MKVSRRSEIPAFAVMSILDRVAQLRAQGREVISLCAGEPSGGAPADVAAAAERAHEANDLGYTSALGPIELREEIAGHYRRWYGLEVDPESVAITTGSSGAFVLTFLSAFDVGDRVALASPGYPAYRNILNALGCKVVDLPCGPEDRFQPSVARLEAAHQQAPLAGLVLASPANPTGTMVSADELAAITAWCTKRGVRLVSDEIYHGITYADATSGSEGPTSPATQPTISSAGEQPAAAAPPRGTSAWQTSRSSAVVSSFSKYWGMTGWRLGWMLMPDDLRAAIDALAGNIALCPPAPAARGALGAFTEASYEFADARVARFASTRAVLLENVAGLGWSNVAPADGAFYLYANISQVLGNHPDSISWASALLEEEGVAVVPGTDFDARGGKEYVRLSFAAGTEAVEGAIERIKRFQSRQA